MDTKETYFISLDKNTITKVSVPDTTEYEVNLTRAELAELESLIHGNEENNFWFAMRNIAIKPFAEREVENMREEEQDNIMRIYQIIHNTGTLETKHKLEEIGFGTKF